MPYLLAAWLLTALFASLLLWRVRLLIRGPVAMGRAEASAFGVLIATVMVGSVFTVLASLPYVFAEDLAWSICLTVGSLFALLGVLERPSWGRVVLAGVLILCANLDRLTTGWACVVGAVLIAVWFGLGRRRSGKQAVVCAGAGRRSGALVGRVLRQLPQVRRALRRSR